MSTMTVTEKNARDLVVHDCIEIADRLHYVIKDVITEGGDSVILTLELISYKGSSDCRPDLNAILILPKDIPVLSFR